MTPSGTLYTDCVEAIFNRHPRVARSALIGLSNPSHPEQRGHQVPALVVEPEPGHFPKTKSDREKFTAELQNLAAESPHARAIVHIYFQRRLPVDVRHNAKIHRLALAREYSKKFRWPSAHA